MISTVLDTLFQIQGQEHGPGVAVAVIKDGQTVYCQGFGLANMEWKQPITPQTVFALASITKPFTATAIMLLEKQGKLQLDDAIQMHLPDYPTQGHHVTLMHLLTHTSGIPNFVTQPGFFELHAQVERSVDDVIALFKDLPFDFEPGTRYSYSNSGYVLLGYILETILHKSYEDIIQQLIFDPLGMTHSYYLKPESIIPFRASGYKYIEGTYQHAPVLTPAVKHAAGGLGSTLEDLILWDVALREEHLLDHSTQERMYKPVQLTDGYVENYGLGWGIGHYRQHSYISHSGGLPGFSTFFGRFPDDNITIILLSNKEGFNTFGLASKITDLLLDLPPVVHMPVSLHPEQLQPMVGIYRDVHGTMEVTREEQTLSLRWGQSHDLLPLSETSFYWADDEDVVVRFENQNAQGIYERLRVIQPFFWFTAERDKPET